MKADVQEAQELPAELKKAEEAEFSPLDASMQMTRPSTWSALGKTAERRGFGRARRPVIGR